MTNINIWSTVSDYTYNQICQQTKKYGHYRIILGLYCSKLLQEFGCHWWIDSGNLLGAYRDGKMIAHDTDFDLGVLATQQQFSQLYQKMQGTLNNKFKVKKIQSYCNKLQVYDRKFGKYKISGSHEINFHNVTVNIQLYIAHANNEVKMKFFKHDLQNFVPLCLDDILPTQQIEYCGHTFKAPHKVVKYLQSLYGYIGLGAVYNRDLRKYEEKKQIQKNIQTKADEGNHEDLKNQ